MLVVDFFDRVDLVCHTTRTLSPMLSSVRTSRVSSHTNTRCGCVLHKSVSLGSNITQSANLARHTKHTSKTQRTPKSAQTRRFCSTSPSATSSASSTTHFGFQSVPVHEKASKVHEVFASVAHNYDVMNDLMSAGVHRYARTQHPRTHARPLL